MNMLRPGVLVLIVTAGLMGCHSKQPDPMARLLLQPDDAALLGYRVQWHSDLRIDYGSRLNDAWVIGDLVVAYEPDNLVSVLDANSGKPLWRRGVGTEQERLSAPARSGDNLAISSETHVHVYSIQTGDLLMSFPLKYLVNTPPAVTSNLAIYGSPQGRVFATDLATGYAVWEYQMGAAINTHPIIQGHMVVVIDHLGDFAALDPLTSELIYRKPTHGHISADPIVDDDHIYIASEDYSLYCFNRLNNKQVWKRVTGHPLTASPMLAGRMVFQAVPSEGVHVFDRSDGSSLWKLPPLSRPITMLNGDVLVHRPGWLSIVDAETGEPLEEVRAKSVHRVLVDGPRDGSVYLVRDDGRITKLGPSGR